MVQSYQGRFSLSEKKIREILLIFCKNIYPLFSQLLGRPHARCQRRRRGKGIDAYQDIWRSRPGLRHHQQQRLQTLSPGPPTLQTRADDGGRRRERGTGGDPLCSGSGWDRRRDRGLKGWRGSGPADGSATGAIDEARTHARQQNRRSVIRQTFERRQRLQLV